MSENTHNPNRETGIAVVSSLLDNKASVTKELIKNVVIKGEANPAYIGVVLKKFAKIAKEVTDDKELKNLIESDTKKYQEGTAKTFSIFGAKITIANRGFWDFSLTEDEYLKRLVEINKKTSELIKAREDELKLKAEAWNTRNTPTGDTPFKVSSFKVQWDELPKLEWEDAYGEIETNPPVKRGTEQLRYSL